jgi:hypothetical protein
LPVRRWLPLVIFSANIVESLDVTHIEPSYIRRNLKMHMHEFGGQRYFINDNIRWMEEILHQSMWFIPLFRAFQTSKVMQDFFHPQYDIMTG